MDPSLMGKILQSFEKPDLDFIVPGYSVNAARILWLIKSGLTLDELVELKEGLEEICLSHHLDTNHMQP